MNTTRKNIVGSLLTLAFVSVVALALSSCEPLDSDIQNDQQEPQDTTAQQAPDTSAKEQPAKQKAKPEEGDLASRVDSLGGALEETNNKLDKVNEEMSAVKDLMQTQPHGEGDVTANPEQAYKRGLDQFFSRDYDGSMSTFGQLLDAGKPEGLQSNCQYWIGESYYGMHRYRDAIKAFEKVYGFESSTKFDDAEMMIGESYLHLGDKARAKQAFRTLIRKYPDSEYVPRARRILTEL